MEKEDRVPDLKARAYQLELYEHAKEKNSLLLLGTGSGKTFISILLIKDFGDQIRRALGKNRKWTVFIVNTVPLVYQQGKAIEQHTPYSVGVYESSKEVDYWTEEKWKEELREHEVLVMVAQIFHDLIISSCLPLEKINLLIFDECHHATGNHPMREIMRRFSKLQRDAANLPRILGLTACPINGKCKFDEVEKIIRDLEIALHSTLVTSVDLEAVKVHTTAPKEVLVTYEASELSEYAETIKEQLLGVQLELDEMTDIEERYIKPLKKKIVNITKVLCHLGDWFGAQAVKYEMENFEEAEDTEDIPVVRYLKKLLCERLEQIYQYCLRKEEQMLNPLDHISIKVKKLLDILRLCGDDKYGLIFVETRNTAKLLYDFLRKISLKNEELSFLVPAYVISANSRNSFDIQLIKEELKKQRETLAAFARGKINFVVCTSILEEGVDVRKCNVVIRFDEPKTFRAYVQSRGRARALPSRYVLMVEERLKKDFLSDVALYRITEKALSKMCHNRQLPTDLEINAHFAEDEIVAPYEPYGPGGPVVTFNSAIPLINQYCGMLPQDRFADLTPSIEYEKSLTPSIEHEKDEGMQVRAKMKLPINAPLKTIIHGDWMSNRVHAKKSAAMAVCIKLHEMNELNEHLRPEKRSDDSILDDLIEIPPEVANRDGMPEPGSKKRRQIYKREMCQGLSPMNDSFKLYSVNVQSNEGLSNGIAISSEAKGMSVGLLCKQALRSNPFSLYSSKWNEVVIRIQLIDEDLSLDSEVISDVKHFHKVVYEDLLGISHSLFDYCPQQTSLFILPLNGNSIDTSLLRHIASLDSLRIHDERSLQDIFKFERSIFEDAVIYPLYKPLSEGMFYVTEIHDNMNPLHPFPESRKQFSSYEQYFLSEYGEEITNKYQPLISAKHLPKDLNFLKKRNTKQASKKLGRDPPKYIPELCGVLPLKASLWWQIMLLPSVLHRLNSLLVAEKLRNLIFPHSSVPDGQWEYNILDFDWPREVITKLVQLPGSNLSVILANSAAKPIHSFMILNAVTLLGANDNFDGERLEVLGDSFLKFVIADRLFLKFSDDHEGSLSERRSKLVCNRTLYSLGKAKHIPEKIKSKVLDPTVNGIMPGFVLKAEVDKKLREINAPHDLWARFGDISEEEFNEEVREVCEDGKAKACYNPWTEHELGDKSVADSVEALLGAFLLVGGNEAAIAFLHNLGIGVCRGSSLLKMQLPVKSALLNDGKEAVEEVERYYKKNCLDDLEKKINYKFRDKSYLVQAVTHSSYSQNRVTDCYQRLEFLGDAVLDYLVTGLIFSSNNSYTPGQLSDLRSYYVKNETLAKVSAKYNLQRHLLYLAPKLQASIARYLNLLQDGVNNEEELLTEDDEVILTEVDVPKALGDLVEAIIGAVYLDSGRSLQKAWDVVSLLMGDIIDQTLTDIPINCIRKLYEKVPAGVKFVKKPMQEDDTMAEYEVTIEGFPPVIGRGKNYKVAKIAAAKKGLRMLKKKEREAALHQSFRGL